MTRRAASGRSAGHSGNTHGLTETVRDPSATRPASAKTMPATAETQHGEGEDVHAPAETIYEHPEARRRAGVQQYRWCKTIRIEPETLREHSEVLRAAPEVPYGPPEMTGPLPEERSTSAANGHEIDEVETILRNVAV